jgi:hypothetical protein
MTGSVVIKDLGLQIQEDVLINDSDKSFTVPAGENWEVLSVQVQLITTANAGTRIMTVEAQGDGSELLVRLTAGATQIESLTRRYNFAANLPQATAFVNDELLVPLPSLFRLDAGMILRVYDIAALDAAADDMEVRALVLRRRA